MEKPSRVSKNKIVHSVDNYNKVGIVTTHCHQSFWLLTKYVLSRLEYCRIRSDNTAVNCMACIAAEAECRASFEPEGE